jgi:DNA processing protein
VTACDGCLRRTALVGRLASHIERARREQRHLRELLALDDDKLIAALGGDHRDELERSHAGFDASAARAEIERTRLTAICRHHESYPPQLLEAADAPAVLHVAGDPQCLGALAAHDAAAVAVVGARRAGPDGLEVARGLGRGLASAGVTVVSGMALGIDSAAHAGALEVGGPTLTVLAGGADVPYPPSKRGLYRAIVRSHAAISEMPPGMRPWRWCFPARNRTIAGLASLTIVVEAAERSGSLITADLAQELGRTVGAVPGPVNAPRCAGTNALLRDGALVIRHAQDALDEALGIGVVTVTSAAERAAAQLDPPLRTLLREVCDGRDTVAALSTTPTQAQAAMVGLAELELLGFLRRGPGGRYVRLS